MLTSYNQMMLLMWEDEPSCPAVHDKLIYELVVLVADKQVHHVRREKHNYAEFNKNKLLFNLAFIE